ncbi:unnamed protein product, partial [Musa hybrid cultivar]
QIVAFAIIPLDVPRRALLPPTGRHSSTLFCRQKRFLLGFCLFPPVSTLHRFHHSRGPIPIANFTDLATQTHVFFTADKKPQERALEKRLIGIFALPETTRKPKSIEPSPTKRNLEILPLKLMSFSPQIRNRKKGHSRNVS